MDLSPRDFLSMVVSFNVYPKVGWRLEIESSANHCALHINIPQEFSCQKSPAVSLAVDRQGHAVGGEFHGVLAAPFTMGTVGVTPVAARMNGTQLGHLSGGHGTVNRKA